MGQIKIHPSAVSETAGAAQSETINHTDNSCFACVCVCLGEGQAEYEICSRLALKLLYMDAHRSVPYAF
jgi:hypothetical protein